MRLGFYISAISHRITISTHFCPSIFPSGSTTAYFFGLLQSTWNYHLRGVAVLPVIYLEGHVELVRIVNGDDSLVSCLIFIVEIQLDWKDEHGNLPVQDSGGCSGGRGTRCAHPDMIFLARLAPLRLAHIYFLTFSDFNAGICNVVLVITNHEHFAHISHKSNISSRKQKFPPGEAGQTRVSPSLSTF